MRDSLWDFNRFSLGKPCQKRLLSKRQLLMLIDLNMNPSPQGDFIVAQDRSFLKPRRSGKSGTSQIVSFEHAKASAALAASCKRASAKRVWTDCREQEAAALANASGGYRGSKPCRQLVNSFPATQRNNRQSEKTHQHGKPDLCDPGNRNEKKHIEIFERGRPSDCCPQPDVV